MDFVIFLFLLRIESSMVPIHVALTPTPTVSTDETKTLENLTYLTESVHLLGAYPILRS